jgi:hypothetical protein
MPLVIHEVIRRIWIGVQAGHPDGMRLELDGCSLDIGCAADYNIDVKRRTAITAPKNGASHSAAVSPLGRDLSRIAERIASSGIKPLNRKDIAREVTERRGGR